MSPALLEQPFEVPSLALQIGKQKQFSAKGPDGVAPLPKGGQWGLPAGLYTVKQIVEANAPLLETCIHHLGPSPDGEPSAREQLIDNLASNLALDTREASISIPTGDPNRAELAKQAINIGKTLIKYVRNVSDVEFDPNYVVRSPCEGHMLKPHVAYLMFGPRSLRHLMQIYNEYLHQMVLLRDALLPFENYEDVLIQINPGPKRGIRHTEEARGAFLTEALTKQVKQRTLLRAAQSFLAPSLSEKSDVGFQYKGGVVLPAFIAGGRSSQLLRWVPVVLDESVEETTFHYALEDYYAADRAELSLNKGENAGNAKVANSTLNATNKDGKHQVQLNIEWDDGKSASFDVGQIARGRRYAHWAQSTKAGKGEEPEKSETFRHDAHAVLTSSQSGLILPPKGFHIIKSNSKVETLALLGKTYPDNIVLVEEGHSLAQAIAAGQGGLPDAGRFFIATGEL
jgi:hypothetical protein